MLNVVNIARPDPIQTDKAESSQDVIWAKKLCQSLHIAQSVLQGDNQSLRPCQWSEQLFKLMIGGGFQSNKDQVTNTDFFRSSGNSRRNMEVPIHAFYKYSVCCNFFIV